jgi:putative membrane protein
MPRPARAALSAALLCVAAPVLAHAGEHHNAAEGGRWSVEPLALSLLLLSALLYGNGYRRMSRAQRGAIAPLWRVSSYMAAAVLVVIALFSPLDERADTSFAWHMLQHLILMLGVGPLMAMANTHLVALMAFPLRPRRRLGRLVNRSPGVRQGASSRYAPAFAALAFAGGLWLWHAPRMYDAALADPALHTVEHLTFVFTSAVFWRMLATVGGRRLDSMSAVVLVTLIGLQGNLLAALITFAPEPLYATYAANQLSDQQIAGLLMWVPAGMVYLIATVRTLFALIKTDGEFGRDAAITKRGS